MTKNAQIINLFTRTKDNSVKTISRIVEMHPFKVSEVINEYLDSLKAQVNYNICDCPKCGKEMKTQLVKHHNCKNCKGHYTST